VPDGYRLERVPRKGLLIGGTAMFWPGYLFAAGMAFGTAPQPLSSPSFHWWLLVPLFGPLGETAYLVNAPAALGSWRPLYLFVATLFVVDAALQIAGLAMLIVGLADSRMQLVRDDAGKTSITIIPSAAGSPLGASVVGRF
jgi:hypothetical protein